MLFACVGRHQIEQFVSQHGVTMFVTLVLFNPDYPALAIYVRDRTRDTLQRSESGAIRG